MKQSTVIFLVIFSLLIILLTACVDDESKNGRKLIGKNASSKMKATLTLTNFEKGGDAGGPAECDGQYHSNELIIVALPTKWYDHGKKCNDFIGITYNGKTVEAMVIDECDSSDGCPDDTLVASKAVWRALEVPEREWGEIKVTWSF